jgi:glycosyltransferase involved in cell wall biosynthesis
MRILFVLSDFPFPPKNGLNLKAFSLIEYMSRRHECDVVAVSSCPDSCEIANFRECCPSLGIIEVYPQQAGWKLVLHQLFMLVTRRPTYYSRFCGPTMRAGVAGVLRNRSYDAIHVVTIGLVGLTDLRRSNAVLSLNDAMAASYRERAQFEGRLLKWAYYRSCQLATGRIEKQLHKMFPVVHVVTSEDATELQAANPKLNVSVIPLAARETALSMPVSLDKADNSVLLVGNWSTNFVRAGMRSFIREVWPIVRRSLPSASLKVLSRIVDDELRSLQSQSDSCSLLGFVDNYYAEVNRSSVVVFSEQAGTGMKNRVLDAMIAGKAIVLSPYAARGFDFGGLQMDIICRNPNEFGSKVVALLADAECANAVGEMLKALAQTKYSIACVGAQWEKLYTNLRVSRAIIDDRVAL